ncbi:hypothetical protein [Haladaptatus halobius]|uniref:hypothetical protein n=1 Tax=Haladaptatus halobius TaxID=2884875 RepID=UPI001D0B8DC9|nr:hypothetical protein [Haladaptatus halobius]
MSLLASMKWIELNDVLGAKLDRGLSRHIEVSLLTDSYLLVLMIGNGNSKWYDVPRDPTGEHLGYKRDNWAEWEDDGKIVFTPAAEATADPAIIVVNVDSVTTVKEWI